MTAKQKKIMSYIIELLKSADKKYLSQLDNKKKLVKALTDEFLFLGTFTMKDLNDYVKPFIKSHTDELYLKKEMILKGRDIKNEDSDYTRLIANIGKQIKEWRLKKHYTQKDLAKKSGTTQQVLSRIEKGKDLKQPTLETYYKIINAAGLKLIFDVIEPKANKKAKA